MARPPNVTKGVAQLMGRRFYTDTPCFCGCDQFYTKNGGCVDCAKSRANARYATPEGKRAQREGDKKRYRKRTGKS